jgi:hypothetical protein
MGTMPAYAHLSQAEWALASASARASRAPSGGRERQITVNLLGWACIAGFVAASAWMISSTPARDPIASWGTFGATARHLAPPQADDIPAENPATHAAPAVPAPVQAPAAAAEPPSTVPAAPAAVPARPDSTVLPREAAPPLRRAAHAARAVDDDPYADVTPRRSALDDPYGK